MGLPCCIEHVKRNESRQQPKAAKVERPSLDSKEECGGAARKEYEYDEECRKNHLEGTACENDRPYVGYVFGVDIHGCPVGCRTVNLVHCLICLDSCIDADSQANDSKSEREEEGTESLKPQRARSEVPASFAFLQVGSTQNAFNPSILAVGRNPTHISYFDDTSKSFVRFIAVVLQSFNSAAAQAPCWTNKAYKVT